MILLLKDYKRFPRAILDEKTTNTSFLRMARLYKAMGIRNNAFILTLLQPELQGVDPFDPNLTPEQMALIRMECQANPWYFFREVVRLPPMAGINPSPLRANRGNIALFWSFFNHIDSALIQIRQTGKSVSTDTLMIWILFIGARNSKIMMITKDDMLRQANIERLKSIRDLLPPYIYMRHPDDRDNQKELNCTALKNTYVSGVAQNSESAANNLGRGLTTPILHVDEGPFINFIGTTIPAALAAGTAVRAEAKKNKQPYGNIFTTTAGRRDDRDGAFMYKMIHNGMVWNEALFDAPDEEALREMVLRNGSGRKAFVNITMSHRQLGYSDEWLYQTMADNEATGDVANRDFLNIWTFGSMRSPLSPALNDAIRGSEKEIAWSEISSDNYILRWYISKDELQERLKTRQFVMGIDTSDAVGRDSIAVVVVDTYDLSVVAAGTYNETNLIRWGMYLLSLLHKYPNTTAIIERRSTAATLIDFLLIRLPRVGLDPFRRLFNRVVDEHAERQSDYQEITRRVEARTELFYDRFKRFFGFVTNAENRPLLYTTVLQNAAKRAGHLVHDKTLSNELRGLVERNGRIDHAAGGNDDHVMAWLLCHWFINHGRNLTHYGIDATQIMAGLQRTPVGDAVSDADYAQQRKIKVMEEFNSLADMISDVTDPIMAAKLEHRLRVLSREIDEEGMDADFSIDALIQKASEERKMRKKTDYSLRHIGYRSRY